MKNTENIEMEALENVNGGLRRTLQAISNEVDDAEALGTGFDECSLGAHVSHLPNPVGSAE